MIRGTTPTYIINRISNSSDNSTGQLYKGPNN